LISQDVDDNERLGLRLNMARTDAMLACCKRVQAVHIAMQAGGTKQVGLSEVVLALRIRRRCARGDLLAEMRSMRRLFRMEFGPRYRR
jgi:hypothetical protein